MKSSSFYHSIFLTKLLMDEIIHLDARWAFKYLNKQQSRVMHFYLSVALTSVFKHSEYSVPWYSLPRGLLYLVFTEFFSFYLMDGLIIFFDFKNSCLLLLQLLIILVPSMWGSIYTSLKPLKSDKGAHLSCL